MNPKVALVEVGSDVTLSYKRALDLIGGIDDLNEATRHVVVKVGVFSPVTGQHTKVDVVDAILRGFEKAPRIFLVESDNHVGKGSERLKVWKSLFSKRVVPFNLSDDVECRQVKVSDSEIRLPRVLLKPDAFVSTHVLRVYKRLKVYEQGSIFKNLLGLVPSVGKARFHKDMGVALLDIYEAIGGIDLAVLDATDTYMGVGSQAGEEVRTNILMVGRDAVAVEAVGAALTGFDPEEMPVIREAMRRSVGEGNIGRIDVVGLPFEATRKRFTQLVTSKEAEM